jgi:DNA (cytosine-5)-methyltransferase 1
VENVREFLRYGPLGANGRPLKSREGETFHAWLNALESIGYTVSYKLVNSADHGGATSRTRLFIMAVRGRRRATWPTPSHERDPQPGLYDPLPRWRAAREIIDWSLPGKSIFGRKHPLKPNTITRIAEGIRRFWKADPEPFLVVLRGTREDQLRCTARSTTLPLPTITGSGAHLGLIEPFLMHTTHHGNGRVHSIDEPVPTITGANRGEQALIEPFLVTYHNGPDGDRRQQELGRPLPTLDTSNRHGIVQPLIIQQFGSNKTRDVDRPLGVITGTSRGMGLVEPFLIPTNWGEREGQRPRTHDIDSPLPTIVGSPTHGLIEPFLVQYNGESGPQSIDDPLNTIPTRDRFGLVLPGGHVLADILFRMLQPHELASGMGFPIGYKFCGTREDIVKQVGNAVEVNCARALLGELLSLVA